MKTIKLLDQLNSRICVLTPGKQECIMLSFLMNNVIDAQKCPTCGQEVK